MARLTDRELDLIQQARRSTTWREWREIDANLLEARREQSRVMAQLLRAGVAGLAQVTGLRAAARFVADRIVQPVRRDLLQRRTVRKLRQLDDHLLHDIGLGRDEVDRVAKELAWAAMPTLRARAGFVTRIGRWVKRRAAIRDLEALDDRMLADIGLLRPYIPAVVDRLSAARKAESAAPTLEQSNYWDSVVRMLRQSEPSRETARGIVRHDPDGLIDIGRTKADLDWVPAGMAGHQPDRHEAA